MDDNPQSFIRGVHLGRALGAASMALAVEKFDHAELLLVAARGLTDDLAPGELARAQRAIRAIERELEAALAARVAPVPS